MKKGNNSLKRVEFRNLHAVFIITVLLEELDRSALVSCLVPGNSDGLVARRIEGLFVRGGEDASEAREGEYEDSHHGN